ncbi:mandelate racemase/muconate lactonizing enzyme family protein [Breznakiella homolactica]|uniref:Mandelate racemase/muconate lactonizing enzyme family protein n=1 Tax=Breznakiella homolactica TaxID=2798577 RepID=A0A7T7XM01_9SPIR|nr:mandelate racemase/muconate lactonizing enzyme family protein [Breznakiella homolactica]QQO08836.1 mandelate racemase/muconate lactonizing enzyme family protein [Breznakiella homolactica]
MKITAIETAVYQWERKIPITNGLHTYPTHTLGLIKIKTDEGIEGIGYGKVQLVKQFEEQLLGEDPLCVERIWHKLWIPKLVGRRGPTTNAISSIDIALWDIRAKAAGMPLYKLLGGAKDRIPVYIAGGYYQEGKDLPALAQEMKDYIAMGATAVKMKVGAKSISEDAKRVEAVRKAVGDEIKVMVDANCAYNLHEAIMFAKRIEEYSPYWFEEPVQPDDYDGFRRIGEATSIPVATGENEYTRFGFRDLLNQGQVPILNADAFVLGGITEFMKVAALAQAHNRMIAPHGDQTIHVHLQCAIQNSLILEYYPERFYDLKDTVYTYSLGLNSDGTVSPPAVPGHGFYPNEDFLKPYRIDI